MKKILIVVDMQNDFIRGSLKNDEGQKIVPFIDEKIKNEVKDKTIVIFTKDTHQKDYLDTMEGKLLPVPHCIEGTCGHEIIPELYNLSKQFNFNWANSFCAQRNMISKETFGFYDWKKELHFITREKTDEVESIELCGVCTDICVISNALILRSIFPNVEIIVDSKCCAGSTPEKHEATLSVMESCQIKVIR